jgi:hypothetical protein
MMRRFATVILFVLATAAAAAEPDLSTPKTAAKSLFNAITAADRDAVAASLYSANAEQQQLASAMSDLIVAGKKLGDASRNRFGKSGDPIGRGMLDPADLTKIDAAEVNETGDTATLTVAGQPRPMSFRKQDGKWKLVITDFAGAAPDNIAKQIQLVRLMTEAIETSAREISAGDYKAPDAALTAIQQRLHGVMLQFYRPATTRSATMPSTSPVPPAASQPAGRTRQD